MDPADEPVRFDSASPERRVRDRRVSSGWVRRVELPPSMARVAWSGVWGGFLIAVGIWITLTALGAAVGLSGARGAANAATFGRGSAAWLYVSALIALFFGGVLGTRLALIVDGTIAWLEATLIWTFALLLTTLFMTPLLGAAARAAAANGVTEAGPMMTNPAGRAWLTFAGIVIAWIVTVLGSFWGRAQSRSRAHTIGLAA